MKEIIRDEYKEFHIGYMPVVLAGQVVGKLGEYERTLAAILDAYLQRSMQIELSAMWDKLRERGYTKPLLDDSKLGRDRRSFPHLRQPHVQQRAGIGADGRAPHGQIAGLPERGDGGHGRHELRRWAWW